MASAKFIWSSGSIVSGYISETHRNPKPRLSRASRDRHIPPGTNGECGMAGDSWDRVPIDAQSINAPLSKAAVFLVVNVGTEPDALAKACSVLQGLDDLVKTVGFRDLSGNLSCV